MERTSLGWTRILYIIMAAVNVIAGFYAILNPLVIDALIPYFIGTLMLLYGGVLLVTYFLATTKQSIGSLILGIAMVVLGLICFGSELFRFTYLIATIVAISCIVVGVIKAINSFTYKSLGMSYWWSVLVLGILDVIVGIMLFMYPASIGIYLGAGLVANGISDFIIAFSAV